MDQILNTVNQIINFVNSFATYDYSSMLFWLRVLAAHLSLFFIIMIIYSVYKTGKIYSAMHVYDKPKETLEPSPQNMEEWRKILARGSSEDEGERKFAIIAADTLIERILDMAGFHGENLGERLKNITPGEFDSLNDLWEAHKVRNRIAHEADFKFSKDDALRALKYFESALHELEYI